MMSNGLRLVERNALVYRRLWLVLLAGLSEPLLYLLGIGYGIGSLIGPLTVDGRTLSYVAFVAPALIATAAMNGAIYDTTFSVMQKLRYERIYEVLLVTPLGPRDLAVGEVGWALVRGSVYSAVLLAAAALLGLVDSAWALLVPLGTLLITFCFAALGCAATTFLRSWQDIENVNLAQLLIFLFSGTLFPLALYPPAIRLLAELSPLTRGVDLVRGLTTGTWSATLLVDAAYLALLGVIGLAVADRRFARIIRT